MGTSVAIIVSSGPAGPTPTGGAVTPPPTPPPSDRADADAKPDAQREPVGLPESVGRSEPERRRPRRPDDQAA